MVAVVGSTLSGKLGVGQTTCTRNPEEAAAAIATPNRLGLQLVTPEPMTNDTSTCQLIDYSLLHVHTQGIQVQKETEQTTETYMETGVA